MADAHGHAHDAGGPRKVEEFVWKGTVALLAIYLFYLLEYILHGFTSHTHSHVRPHPLNHTHFYLYDWLQRSRTFLLVNCRVSPLILIRIVEEMGRSVSSWKPVFLTGSAVAPRRGRGSSILPCPLLGAGLQLLCRTCRRRLL